MKMRKIISLLAAACVACTSVISLSAWDMRSWGNFTVILEGGYAMTDADINEMMNNSEKMQDILSEKLYEDYLNRTVYVGSPFRIHERRMVDGGKFPDCFSTVFSEDGNIIGMISFTKGNLYRDTANFNYSEAYFDEKSDWFPFDKAISFIRNNPDKEYILATMEYDGVFMGALDNENNIAATWNIKGFNPESKGYIEFKDTLVFDKLKAEQPMLAVNSDTFTLDKSTARAYKITDDFITQTDFDRLLNEGAIENALIRAFGENHPGETYYVSRRYPFRYGYLNFKNNKPVYWERADEVNYPVWNENGEFVGILFMMKQENTDGNIACGCYCSAKDNADSTYSYYEEFLQKADPSKEYALVGLGTVTLGNSPISAAYIAIDRDGNKILLHGRDKTDLDVNFDDTDLKLWNTDRSVADKTLNEMTYKDYFFDDNVISKGYFTYSNNWGPLCKVTMPVDITLGAGVEE